uniref:5-hydroxytryptamine receptor 4-like n=1 Tax=Saccoglossus kowalevskii TaxID=10224 RepID=A0ABM0M3H7_SACKO|nr:PREDICTED: 5-hydroxytryptamine receptor 4-like [Saccoglossus kowalevskii]
MTLTIIAINRYVYISKSVTTYSMFFNSRKNSILIAYLWIASLVIGSLPMMGVGKAGYNIALQGCHLVHGDNDTWLYMVVLIGTVFMSIMLASISYFLTFRRVKESHTRIEASMDIDNAGDERRRFKARKRRDEELRLLKQLCIVFGIFCISWLPFSIVYIADQYSTLPYSLHFAVTTVAWSNSSLNPFLYAWMNKRFRRAYGNILIFWRRSNDENTIITVTEATL